MLHQENKRTALNLELNREHSSTMNGLLAGSSNPDIAFIDNI